VGGTFLKTDDSIGAGRISEASELHGSIQTPPPSRNSKRPGAGTQAGTLPASTMADPRRNSNPRLSNMGPPETPSRIMQASPQLFPALQFSPDLFQPQFSGPASAPAYPQQRLFWDPNATNANGNTVSSGYQDPFGVSQNDFMPSFIPSPAMSHGFENTNVIPDTAYDLPSSQTSQATVSVSPYFSDTTFPASFTASPRPPPPVAEDPSLFLSSPARRFGPPAQSFNATKPVTRVELQPYHHQIEESKREEEIERAKKTKPQRCSRPLQSSSSLRRPASPNVEDRPGLKRSLTDSGAGGNTFHLRQQSQVSFAEPVSVGDGGTRRLSRGGRSSPLKRLSRTSWQSSSDRPGSRQRTSLTFTIDKDGRAKTLVTTVPETVDSHMSSDDDSADSDADSLGVADFDIARSQGNTFGYVEDDPLQPSDAKLKSEARNHSKNSSYSSTMTSSNSTYHSSRTSSNFGSARPRSSRIDHALMRTTQPQANPPRQSLARTNRIDGGYLDEDSDDERGDAQHALRAVLKDRPRSTSIQAGLIKRQSGPSAEFHSSPPIQDNRYGVFNASPTTITDPDLATPSTDRESYASNNSTRCVCNSPSPNGEHMIQWYAVHVSLSKGVSRLTIDSESCSKWLHTNCVGIDARHIPTVYICAYCAQTPMRHGRIREPSRAAALAPASPLAHKSNRYR
jgi:hypothetical protein